MSARIGSLFSGYRGLDMAVEAITGADTVWCSDIDPGANKILAHHWPDVPNLGDIAAVNWGQVEPVDILTGGFPCQDVSAAGKRAGLVRYGDKNRSGLWAEMARAVDILRPQLVVAENVRGLLSAKTDANPDLFDCLACMAHSLDHPMRALGAVVGDLAALGYDAAWHGVRASDTVGFCHQRFRVFVIAWPADTDREGLAQWSQQPARQECPAAQRGDLDAAGMTLLRTPTRSDGAGGPGNSGRDGGNNLRTAISLLPTPQVADATGGHASRSGARSNELLLPGLVKTFLPTPRATDGTHGGPNQRGSSGDYTMPSAVHRTDWGIYEPAIRRQEAVTRPAPEPTEIGPRGGRRLAPEFSEWMMGLPAGHVTAVPDIAAKRRPSGGESNRPYLTRNTQLKAIGNGVVPQQAECALRHLLSAVSQ